MNNGKTINVTYDSYIICTCILELLFILKQLSWSCKGETTPKEINSNKIIKSRRQTSKQTKTTKKVTSNNCCILEENKRKNNVTRSDISTWQQNEVWQLGEVYWIQTI